MMPLHRITGCRSSRWGWRPPEPPLPLLGKLRLRSPQHLPHHLHILVSTRLDVVVESTDPITCSNPTFSELWPNRSGRNFDMIIKDFPSCMLDRPPCPVLFATLLWENFVFPFNSLCETLNLNLLLPSSTVDDIPVTVEESNCLMQKMVKDEDEQETTIELAEGHVNYGTKIYAWQQSLEREQQEARLFAL